MDVGSPVHNVLAVLYKLAHGSSDLSSGSSVLLWHADADELISFIESMYVWNCLGNSCSLVFVYLGSEAVTTTIHCLENSIIALIDSVFSGLSKPPHRVT